VGVLVVKKHKTFVHAQNLCSLAKLQTSECTQPVLNTKIEQTPFNKSTLARQILDAIGGGLSNRQRTLKVKMPSAVQLFSAVVLTCLNLFNVQRRTHTSVATTTLLNMTLELNDWRNMIKLRRMVMHLRTILSVKISLCSFTN